MIGALALTSDSAFGPSPATSRIPIVTPLVLTELTQKAPNTGKISKEFEAAAALPRPVFRMPRAVPAAPQPIEPLPAPPKAEVAAVKPELPPMMQVAPQIQTVEKPALAFENPVPAPAVEPGRGLPLPKVSVPDALQGTLHGGPGGSVAPVNSPASVGVQPSNMQLLSDPMGVDFRPYLSQVQAAVKRYWMLVWPESARRGATGRVSLQFTIDRNGTVPHLVNVSPSGMSALDRAAVAAISGSVPFPPFPKDFKGQTISLQLNFSYNLPAQ
jgi:TonB family protein